MKNYTPFDVVKMFEKELCNYTGAKYAVTVNCCTNALLLVMKYLKVSQVDVPKKTYMSVPMSVINAGGTINFTNEEWSGEYQLKPYPIWDSARLFIKDMYKPSSFMCVSFHWKKILAIGTGGAILHDNDEADKWFRKMRFSGRTDGIAPVNDIFDLVGMQCNMIPRDAAEGLSRLEFLPEYNSPQLNNKYEYQDLSKAPCFQNK